MRPTLALVASLALSVSAPSAAVLPADAVLVTSAATIDAGALPVLLVLAGGPALTFGIEEPLAAVPHGPDDLILYEAASGQARLLDATAPTPAAHSLHYHDPEGGGSTLPALFVSLSPGALSESTLSLADGRSGTLASLLSTPGSIVSYAPEPGAAALQAAGAALLFALRWRRRLSL